MSESGGGGEGFGDSASKGKKGNENIYPSLVGGGGGGMEDVVKRVKTVEYQQGVLDFISRIDQESRRLSMNFLNPEPLGKNLQNYAQLGCAIFNNNNYVQTSNFTTDDMRQLWSSHLSPILEASRHTDDPNFTHKNWTKTLLKSLSPFTLMDNIHTTNNGGRPMNPQHAERILGILTRRILGLIQQLSSPTTNTNNNNINGNLESIAPPLRIAVFGGPTVEGMGCRRSRVEIPHGSIMANPSFCAFPYRLEQFINGILLPIAVRQRLVEWMGNANNNNNNNDIMTALQGFRMVEVLNLGEEGTNSEFSTSIVRNRMYPPFGKGMPGIGGLTYGGGPPDVIIHAYGIDDFGRDVKEDMSPFYKAVRKLEKQRDRLEYEAVGSPSKQKCRKENAKPPPIVISAVLEETSLGKEKSSFQSVMTAILGDALDDAEEGELTIPKPAHVGDTQSEEGGAFGMAGHLATSWVLAFDLAYAAINHCASIRGKDPLPPAPLLFSNNNSNNNGYNNPTCDNGIDPPCIFSFLAGPKGTASRPSAIASSLKPYVVENTGWQPESDMTAGFARKTGLVGTGDGAALTLLFRNVTRPVRRFDVVTLRSTSSLWKDGLAKFVIVTGGDFSHGSEIAEASSRSAKETSFEISAELIVEGRRASGAGGDQHISYHFGLDLVDGENSGDLGTDVLVRIILTKGSKFKILGLMLCE